LGKFAANPGGLVLTNVVADVVAGDAGFGDGRTVDGRSEFDLLEVERFHVAPIDLQSADFFGGWLVDGLAEFTDELFFCGRSFVRT